jgi:hypothetical protein
MAEIELPPGVRARARRASPPVALGRPQSPRNKAHALYSRAVQFPHA